MVKRTYKETVRACYLGYITQAIINNLAPLLFTIFKTNYGISFSMLGNLILVNFMTQLVVDVISIKIADRIGYRKLIVFAHFCSALGIFLLGVLPGRMAHPYMGLVGGMMVSAVGGGLIEVLISPIVEGCPGEEKAAAMSMLHSFYCWGHMAVVILTTVALRMIGLSHWYLVPMVWALLPLFNLFNFTTVPIRHLTEGTEPMPLRRLLRSKIFLTAALLMICAGASEQAMSQWSSLFAEMGLGVPKMVGDILGPCMFALLMGLGRAFYGKMGSRIPLRKALITCCCSCILAYLMAALMKNPVLSLIGCGLCGLSVSLMWPGMFSYTSESYPTGGTAMFAILAMCGDMGCSLGPWVTGMVSDAARHIPGLVQIGSGAGLNMVQTGLKAGLLTAVVFPAIMLAGVIYMKKARRKL